MLIKIFRLFGYLFLITFLVVTLAFSARETRSVICSDIQVEFMDNDLIRVSKDEIIRLINAADNQLIGKEIKQINSHFLETEVEKHQAILNADVYKVLVKGESGYSGVLGVRVKHREPVLRIMSTSGSYYMDITGEKIPVSSGYAAHVLVATGYFTEDFAKERLLPFVFYLEENPFWKAQIEQLHVEQNGNVVLSPLVGDHLIELGSLDGFQEKLRNVKAFYEQVLTANNWTKYRKIDAKYKNQVIAKKR